MQIKSILLGFFAVLPMLTSCQTTQRTVLYKIKVQNGDTLAAIANRYDTTSNEIWRLNGLRKSDSVFIGQVLKVQPGPGGIVAKHEAEQKAVSKQEIRLDWPVKGKVVSQFGQRKDGFHTGLDVKASEGTSIVTAAAGKVVFAGTQNGYGHTVIIDHGSGFRTLYGHCDALHVKEGEAISKGDVIADVGSSGNASGPHLHFELRSSGDKPIDPMPFLTQRRGLLFSGR